MAGIVPAMHVLAVLEKKNVDARITRGRFGFERTQCLVLTRKKALRPAARNASCA
jgi:hypothetical protein